MTDTTETEPRSDWEPRSHPAPYTDYENLRRQCPVAYSDKHGGFWSLMRHADVSKAARDWKSFRSGQPFVEFPDFTSAIPITLNPPEHTAVRTLLNTYFRPDFLAPLEEKVRGYVDEHLGELLSGGRGDAITLAKPVPERTLAALLGMPDDTYLMFLEKHRRIFELAGDAEATSKLLTHLWTDEVAALVDDRKAHPRDPRTDLMSGVLAAEIGGEPIPYESCVAIGVMLFAAGGETTTTAITTSLHHLATHPEDQERLRAEPSLIPVAVEEFLRLNTPLHHLARRTTKDVTVGERTIPADSVVALNYASANRDETVFPDAGTCVLDRTPNRHLAFGFGVHQCVGAPVARMELHVALEAVLARTASIELDGEPVEGTKANLASGFASLPLKFTFPE
ncbi:cytochrome P450 [Streptomyces sp. NPDC047081]|uniref:cytochrome P450 n=1 Tax=Streptomyces sp. NPDC047081 TaxID=3154706 RepID=UPI0033C42AFB